MSQDPSRPPLDLPPVEDVERALTLVEADRDQIPGLYGLNAEKVPTLRLVGFQVVLVFAALHNVALGTGPGWPAYLTVAGLVEAYALVSLFVLRRYFAVVRRLHLGTFFIFFDMVLFTAVVWVTGSAGSWIWPLYLVRVADQMWIGRRRATSVAAFGLVCYGGLLLGSALVSPEATPWEAALFKLGALGAFSWYLIAAAGLPWDLQERTQAARDLIVRLETQSQLIAEERARAEQASLAKTHFLARMSHELRTPLNSVVGFTNVLLKKLKDLPEREHDYLVRIRENGVHLLALINDILDISRIEEGKMEIVPTSLDLEQLVRNTVHQLEGRMVGSKIRLSMAFPDGLGPVVADEARLRQVLINLVGNALKFTEEGWVRVEVGKDPATGAPRTVSVSDSGIGIAESRLASIFEAFEQGDGGYTRKFGGTGLGLSISRSLCELMGFELSVRSVEGKGSTFTVDLGDQSGADPLPSTTGDPSPPAPRPA